MELLTINKVIKRRILPKINVFYRSNTTFNR